MPPLALKCIASWKKYCPDYEIIEWNESNFDVNYNRFTREAYESKKWAFVSDVARLWALTEHGGIYMDTDCELIRPIDNLLDLDAVSGFEGGVLVTTALMGCTKGHELFVEMLTDYDDRQFKLPNGELNTTTNVSYITDTLLKYGLVLNNQLQTVRGFTLYPTDFFCPKNYGTGKLKITSNTYSIHHYSSSWQDEISLRRKQRRNILCKFFGVKIGVKLYNAWHVFETGGLRGVFAKIRKGREK